MTARRAIACQLIDAARKDVRLISKAEDKAAAYLTIAAAQAKAGDATGARKSLEEATAAAVGILQEDKRTSADTDIMLALAECGQVAKAKAMAATIRDAARMAAAYSRIARAEANRGDKAGARQTLELAKSSATRISEEWYRLLADVDIAIGQAEAGDVAAAKAIAENLTMPAAKGSAYRAIAKAQAKLGDLAAAKASAALIDDGPLGRLERAFAYTDIAEVQAEAGDAAGANATVTLVDGEGWRVMAFTRIAVALIRAGDKVKALHTIELLKASAAKINSPFDSCVAYLSIAEAQASGGDVANANESLALARRIAAGVDREREKVSVYPHIALVQARTGDLAGAKATAAQITDESARKAAYRAIAIAQAETGAVAEAIDLCAGVTSDPGERCKVLANAASELCSKP